jgi:hypothetical protein
VAPDILSALLEALHCTMCFLSSRDMLVTGLGQLIEFPNDVGENDAGENQTQI